MSPSGLPLTWVTDSTSEPSFSRRWLARGKAKAHRRYVKDVKLSGWSCAEGGEWEHETRAPKMRSLQGTCGGGVGPVDRPAHAGPCVCRYMRVRIISAPRRFCPSKEGLLILAQHVSYAS